MVFLSVGSLEVLKGVLSAEQWDTKMEPLRVIGVVDELAD